MTAVGDGSEALEAARLGPPHLVLTDVMLPGLTGVELLRELRADPRTAHVPVVMLTARVGAEFALEGFETGADDYIAKPFSSRELIARIRTNLEVGRSRAELWGERARLEAAKDAHRRSIQALEAVAKHVDAASDLAGFYGGLAETAARLVGGRRAGFFRLQGDGTVAIELNTFGIDSQLASQLRGIRCRPDGDGLVERVVFQDHIFNARLGNDPELQAYRPWLEAIGARNALVIQWRAGGEPIGLVAVYDSANPEGFTDEDAWVLRIVSLAAAVVWQLKMAEESLGGLQAREIETLRQHAERMSGLERVKTEFLNLAAHELRTPLTVISGYITLLQESVVLHQDLRAQILAIMAERAAHMNTLVSQMLETSRFEEGRIHLERRAFDLRQVVRQAVQALAISKRQGHSVLIDEDGDEVLVEGDRVRVGSIIENLLDNALKYSPEGGAVTCRVGSREGAAIFEVSDQGLGIAPTDMPGLFTRFGRVVTPENSHISGTGLGLYLSREIAIRHGGDILVRSEPGHGSTFTLYLPAKPTTLEASWSGGPPSVENWHHRITGFSVSDAMRCNIGLRYQTPKGGSITRTAGFIVRYLHERLLVSESSSPAIALVRLFRTQRLEELAPGLLADASKIARARRLGPASLWLTLEGSAGERKEWSDPALSINHRVIPVFDAGGMKAAPMVTDLIRQLGVDTEALGNVSRRNAPDLAARTLNVFHVPDARGSDVVPDQGGFVVPFGISSVLGFGGVLTGGELFAVIMFSKVPVSRDAAENFKPVARTVKELLDRHRPDIVSG